MPLRLRVIGDIADLFGVLAHPSRLRILALLHEGERDVSDLKARLEIGGATVSQHLAVLRAHHLVTARREGAHIRYSLRDPRIADLVNRALDILADDVVHARELRSAIERVRLRD